MKAKSKKAPASKVLQVFEGQKIAVQTDLLYNNEPISYMGILVDEDDLFYYLSQDGSLITNTVAKKHTVSIIDSDAISNTEAIPPETVFN